MSNAMRDVWAARLAGPQTCRPIVAGLVLLLWFGLAPVSAGRAQSDRDYPLVPCQDHLGMSSLAPVVEAVIPSVVHVSAVQGPSGARAHEENSGGLQRSKRQNRDGGLSPTELDALLRRFFSGTSAMPIRSSGSGFIIDPAGYVVTEDHVIENAEKVTVTLQDAKPYSARIIGRDPKTDLALLKIDVGHALPYVAWGDSDAVRVGDWVITIGNPFGLDASVSSGIISGRGRDIHLGPYDDFLQIDAAINRGNSGGPAFDLNGRVIGINTAILSPNTGSVGIGFAIPANLAQPVIAQLRTRGKVERGWLGAHIQELTPALAQIFGLPKVEGGLVADLIVNGPAARAGFARGDVILSVNGRKVSNRRDLLLVLAALPIGQRVEVDVWREGAETALWPVIGEMPTENSEPAATGPRPSQTQTKNFIIGLNLVPLTKARRELLEIPPNVRGVLVLSIDDDSAFLELGIRPGDVIESINQHPVTSPAEAKARLREALASTTKNVLMLINRNGTNRYLAVSLESKPNGQDES
jgi:serine protease Do